jgi:predicted signal transduction protein with EAL and GGDEF domain
VSESDTVARFGSDEFVIILPDVVAAAYADAAAHRILSAFSRPFEIGGREFVVTASVGMTIAPTDGDDSQSLLRNADAAVRQAKAVGRNACRFFTPEMNRKVSERLTLESRLRHAVARNELSLVYQPIVELRTGATVGAEALLRWNNPDLGQVPPDHFIPVAEDTGLIMEIGEWVLREACREAGGWAALTGRPISLAVNISACQFRRLELVRTVTEALASAGLPADCLDLEITERLLVENAATTMVILEELHEMGIRISIDDFGTGYSSLSYLKHLPVQTLKIDRSFVKDVPTGPRDSALTAAIVALAHNLDLQVVGEGVETQAQLDFLGTHGCDFIQGYFFSRPLPAPAFRAFLTQK